MLEYLLIFQKNNIGRLILQKPRLSSRFFFKNNFIHQFTWLFLLFALVLNLGFFQLRMFFN